MSMLFYEDFFPGWEITSRSLTVSQEDIIAFASEYDMQPFHTDPEKAKHTFPGRLIASGWHSCALLNRLLAESLLLNMAGQGSPGIDEARWIVPLFPGDEISLRTSVEEVRPLQSRPEIGMVKLRLDLLKKDGTLSTLMHGPVFILRRQSGPEPAPQAKGKPKPEPVAVAARAQPAKLLFAGDYTPGTVMELGSHHFPAEEIIRFARQFDPQYFHLDAEAAKSSLFGGLCASGWHTAAGWMRVTSKQFASLTETLRSEGGKVPELGPSPGFSNLKWRKPVFAGDTVTYYSEVTHMRASASRHGWGLLFNHNTGCNQHGEEVFAFDSVVLREMHAPE